MPPRDAAYGVDGHLERSGLERMKEGLVAPGNGRVRVKPNPGARHVGGFRHLSSAGNAKALDGEVGLRKVY